MWRVVCIGPGPLDRVRRVIDRGPLHADKAKVTSMANLLRSTGLYESVKVEGSSVKAAAVAAPDPFDVASETPFAAPKEKSLDDLSALIDEQVSPATE